MKVILEPTVTVVGSTTFHPHPVYSIPGDGTDAEKLGAFAAKGCYDSYGENGRANIANQEAILEHQHGSVLEHAQLSFFIEGITRALSLELNRHRPFAISQRSTRYTREEDSAIVLEPYYGQLYLKYKPVQRTAESDFWCLTEDGSMILQMEPEGQLILEYLNGSWDAIKSYKRQVELLEKLNPNNLSGFDLRKWARGKARNILPHGLETRGTWTMNYRALRWFIEARSNRHAEPEIRRLADVLLEAAKSYAPTYFSDFQCVDIVDGIAEWAPMYRKV